MKPDLILLHAPSVYDFRKKPILYGPVSDVIPSTQIFEMYPIGFMTLMGHLQRHGYSVRIINVALKMLRNPRFDVGKLIRKLKPRAFGIDLHWMVHAHGSLAVAEIVKKYHPDTPVIFGGLSASYYHEELIRYPQVDYILRGDATEDPLRQLMAVIKTGGLLEEIPGLTWKEGDTVRSTELAPLPPDLDNLVMDYRTVMKSTVRYLDFLGHVPFNEWPSYPIVLGLSCRGCTHNCIICGGSSFGYKRTSGHHKPVFRSPEQLARDIGLAAHYINAPTFVLGDIMQAGEDYAIRFLESLKTQKLRNHLAIEFFTPPPRHILERIAQAVPQFNIQISPETHDAGIRKRSGRPYDNTVLEQMMADALEVGCQRFDMFFLIGLSGQTKQSVRDTIAYCRTLLDRFGRGKHTGWFHPYISPLAPFLDPGSRGFEQPEKHGYRVLFRTVEKHRQALAAPAWKYTLNYETDWMTRDDIADITYEAALLMNRLKVDYHLQDEHAARQIEQRILLEQDVLHKIDEIVKVYRPAEQPERIADVMRQFEAVGPHTLCHEHEMKWPVNVRRFNVFRIMRDLFLRPH
jgi:B12-binding domain/radical SAM domain protein